MEVKRTRAAGEDRGSCWGKEKGAGKVPSVRVAASLPLTSSPKVLSAGSVGHRQRAGWGRWYLRLSLPTDTKGEGGGDKGAGKEREEGESRVRGRGWGVRAREAQGCGARGGRAGADKAPAAGGRGRAARAHPGIRRPACGGGREAGRGRQVYLNIRLCHTPGAADNFITSEYKNDCRRMQMARRSQPPASALPRAAGGGPGSRRRRRPT